MIEQLYQAKKPQVTLDDKKAIISKLGYKFPIVSILGGGYAVEFCETTVERILNGSCEFKS